MCGGASLLRQHVVQDRTAIRPTHGRQRAAAGEARGALVRVGVSAGVRVRVGVRAGVGVRARVQV